MRLRKLILSKYIQDLVILYCFWLSRGQALADTDYRDEWLAQQYREKRRCRITCVAITLSVVTVVLSAVFVVYYFLKVRK